MTRLIKSNDSSIHYPQGDGTNIVDAAAKGASQAIMLVLNIAASIIAFMAFVAFLDGIVGKSSFVSLFLKFLTKRLTCASRMVRESGRRRGLRHSDGQLRSLDIEGMNDIIFKDLRV